MATTDHSDAGRHGAPPRHVLGHEPTDVSLKGVTRMAILSFGVIFVILGLIYGIWKAFESYSADRRPLPALSGRKPGELQLPTGPLVLTDEAGALRQLRAQEREVLDHYGWVDKNQGIVRMPIDRAIDLLVEQPNRIAPADGAAPAPAPATATAAPATPAAPAAKPPAPGHE
jgi:hypothetical protein